MVIAEFQRGLVPPEDPGVRGDWGRDFPDRRFKRVRLNRKTPGHLVSKVSLRPIPEGRLQDPIRDISPDHGRVVVRRVHWDFSPGSRLDREGIG